MTEFRVLGPVEVHDERTGRRVVPPGAKQRTLLAALVVGAGRTLTVDRLADELWGDAPPERAANAVQAHVARLRRLLRDCGGGEWISTEPMGYLLRLRDATTDAQRFHRLAAEGRAAAATDPAHAAGLLRRALAVWRGPALQDCLPGPWCAAEAERLEEQRLAAVEKLYETRLRSAPGEDLTGELERLTHEHPLRERLYDLSMAALCRAGRGGEALGVYERARRRMVGELGVEPGPALRARLEEAVRLASDGSGGRAAHLLDSPAPGEFALPAGPSDAAALLDLGDAVARLRERVDDLSRTQGLLLRRIDELTAAVTAGRTA